MCLDIRILVIVDCDQAGDIFDSLGIEGTQDASSIYPIFIVDLLCFVTVDAFIETKNYTSVSSKLNAYQWHCVHTDIV